MIINHIKGASSMPVYNPSYPKGPFRFRNREYLIISYETDGDAVRAAVPEPLEMTDPVVHYEFIRMPDSHGFGDYTESGQVIPVEYQGEKGNYVHLMFLDSHPPIAGGREIWGFPKKLAKPKLSVQSDTLVGTLDYGDVRVAVATMGYKHSESSHEDILKAMSAANFLVKFIPHVDGTPRICELVRYCLTDIHMKGAWSGPGTVELAHHALAPVADLPVKKVISALHFISDLTLPYGKVVYDYLS